MPAHSETRQLSYPADLMFAIVADVEKYPQFLPWVVSTRILRRENANVFHAVMCVGFAGFRECYTSRVVLDPAARSVEVRQIAGPFKRLENRWRFTPHGQGCLVEFSIVYEFKSLLLNAVAGSAFGHVFLKMADAFEARAKKSADLLR